MSGTRRLEDVLKIGDEDSCNEFVFIYGNIKC